MTYEPTDAEMFEVIEGLRDVGLYDSSTSKAIGKALSNAYPIIERQVCSRSVLPWQWVVMGFVIGYLSAMFTWYAEQVWG